MNMTGRDLILYILSNGLENEPVFKNGKFIGFITDAEAAEKLDVGVATVWAWVAQGRLDGTYFKTMHEGMLVPANCKLEDIHESKSNVI